jgi:hypothetical protein
MIIYIRQKRTDKNLPAILSYLNHSNRTIKSFHAIKIATTNPLSKMTLTINSWLYFLCGLLAELALSYGFIHYIGVSRTTQRAIFATAIDRSKFGLGVVTWSRHSCGDRVCSHPREHGIAPKQPDSQSRSILRSPAQARPCAKKLSRMGPGDLHPEPPGISTSCAKNLPAPL